MNRSVFIVAALCLQTLFQTACTRRMNDPNWATEPYPAQYHTTNIVDMIVTRHGTNIEIANSTDIAYTDVDVWVNKRFLKPGASIPAHQTVRLSLWDFHDEFGDLFNGGGFFRTHEATPVRLVTIQAQPNQPMVGLITVRSEPVRLKADPQRRR